jgi:hypothetical protein
MEEPHARTRPAPAQVGLTWRMHACCPAVVCRARSHKLHTSPFTNRIRFRSDWSLWHHAITVTYGIISQVVVRPSSEDAVHADTLTSCCLHTTFRHFCKSILRSASGFYFFFIETTQSIAASIEISFALGSSNGSHIYKKNNAISSL